MYILIFILLFPLQSSDLTEDDKGFKAVDGNTDQDEVNHRKAFVGFIM